jgi:hypothetical protein
MDDSAPWDTRLALAEDDPRARIARALERQGHKVVRIGSSGHPLRTMATVYTFDCGCRRTYKIDQMRDREGEYLTPCGRHKDLVNQLTAGAEQATIAGQQEDTNGEG